MIQIEAVIKRVKGRTWIAAEVQGKLLKTVAPTDEKAIAQLMRMMQADGIGRYQLSILEEVRPAGAP
jgi:hypothetical protein